MAKKLNNTNTKRADIYKISPKDIVVPEGFNSRVNYGDIDELAQQIKEVGVLNPITVQTIETEDGEKYSLIDGERRYRAVMQLIDNGENIEHIKAFIIPSNLPKDELYVQQAMRNEGKNFSEYEWAILANKMRTECGITNMSEIARRLGKNVVLVFNWLQLLEMPEDFQEMLRTNQIKASVLRKIVQANGGDFDKARKEIEKLKEGAKTNDKGEKKISLKNLDFTSQTKLYKDTKTLLKGLSVLMEYAQEASSNGEMEMDIVDIYEKLKSGFQIDEIFNINQKTQETA